MVDDITVCCMCGDVGFPDKLFRCMRCLSRSQHTYCGNYYEEYSSSGPSGICDWCRSEGHTAAGKYTSSSKRSSGKEVVSGVGRSDYTSSERITQQNIDHAKAAKSVTGSGKSGGRRYKLLKDVLC